MVVLQKENFQMINSIKDDHKPEVEEKAVVHQQLNVLLEEVLVGKEVVVASEAEVVPGKSSLLPKEMNKKH